MMPATAPSIEPTTKVATIARVVSMPTNCAPSTLFDTARMRQADAGAVEHELQRASIATERPKMIRLPSVSVIGPSWMGCCSR